MVSATLFISLVVFLILQIPVGIAIGCSTLLAIFAGGVLGKTFIAQAMITGTDSFPIMAIPLFILAGELMAQGGVSKRILNVANVFFGRITGGLAIVTVVVCMFFAAVSGSGPATVAAVGSMVVPTMLQKGYSKSFTLALVACAGSIGVIIPPSIPMVLYGVGTSTSISSLFMGGFGPGILIGGALIGWCYFYSKKNGWKFDQGEEKFILLKALKVVWEAKWALINPVIILGGIYAGIFTPTEAAAVAAVYAFVCGVFIYKEIKFKKLLDTIAGACSTTATTMVIIGCATAFAKILTIEQIPAAIASGMLAVTSSKVLILVFINILLLLVGCFMDTTPAMMVLAPILYPVAVTTLGLNPVHLGLIMVFNLSIGFITPPLGINLFVASRVGDVDLGVVIRGIIPFIIINLIVLQMITYIPEITTFLPNMFL